MAAKRVLLTGGTGFVGANLARRLLADGHEVWLLLRSNSQRWRVSGLENEVQSVFGNLSDPADALRMVEEVHPDWIFHLAAHGAYSTQTEVQQIVRTNFLSTVNLIEAAVQVGFEAFVNTGSSSEYGFKSCAPTEQEWVDPNSHYAVTKAAATQYCRFTGNRHGLNMPTLRLYSIYGPYEEPTRLIPTLVIRAMQGNYPPLANPDIARDYVEIGDTCEAFVLAAQRGSEGERGAVYNVGSGRQTSLKEIAELAGQIFQVPSEPIFGSMASRGWDTNIWVSDPSLILSDLGWSAGTHLEVGLRRMGNWLNDEPNMLSHYRTQIEAAAVPRS